MHARVSPHLIEHYGVGSARCRHERSSAPKSYGSNVDRPFGVRRDAVSRRIGEERCATRRAKRRLARGPLFLMAVLGTGGEKEYPPVSDRSRPRGCRDCAPCATGARSHERTREFDPRGDASKRGSAAQWLRGRHGRARSYPYAVHGRTTTDDPGRVAFVPSLARPGGRRPPTGKFRPLHFDETVTMSPRARAARDYAVRMRDSFRFLDALSQPTLTDERKRAFARRATIHGGVVIIDQSGSMDLDEASLAALLRRAPDALVVGYSHRPGDPRRDTERLGSWPTAEPSRR